MYKFYLAMMTALLAACLGAAATGKVGSVLTAAPGGGWITIGLPYEAKISAAGYLESLQVNGFDFLTPAKDPAHGLYLANGETRLPFTAAKQAGDDSLLLDGAGARVALRFLPGGITVTVTNLAIQDANCLRLDVNGKVARAKQPETGVEYAMPTGVQSGKLRLLAASGANLTLPGQYLIPRGADYYVKLPYALAKGPESTFTMELAPVIHPEDRVKVVCKAASADMTYWDGGPQPYTTELTNMQTAAFRGTVTLKLTSYLTKTVAAAWTQKVNLPPGGAKTLDWTLDKLAPGLYLVEVSAKCGEGVGVCATTRLVYAAAQIAPTTPPADFDAFWDRTLQEQAKIPLDLQVSKVKDLGNSELYKFNFAGLLGYRCYGYLTVPKDKSKRYPAMLILPSSGMHGLQPPTFPKDDTVGMAININTADVDLPAEQYDWRTWPAPYLVTGILEKDYYSLRFCYAACARAAEVLAARSEVDPARMLVTGSSQGGGLTLVAAGLYPKFKAAVANVPGLCRLDWNFDYFNPPYFPIAANADTRPMIARVLPYFDAASFTHRIQCPTWVSLGLFDDVTPSMGVFCAYNALRVPKQLMVQPYTGHGGGYAPAEAVKGVWP